MASTAPIATYAVELKDQVSGAAMSSVASLDRLRSKIDEDVKVLRNLQAAMSRLKGGSSTNIAAFKKLRDQIAAQKAAIASAQGAYLELGGTFEQTAASSGGLWSMLQQFRSGGGAIAAGVLAVGAALVGLAAAAATATAALIRYAIAQSDARRSELLHLEGLTTIRRYHGLAAGSALDLRDAIDRVSDSSALGRSDVSGYAQQLYRMGLRGRDLQDALEGVTTVASVQGDQMARRFAGMSAAAIRTGGSVRRLADDVRTRLGGIARRQTLGLDRQMERLRGNVARIFSDLRTDGFLSALHDITSQFSQTTVTGRALRRIVEALFQPLLDGAAGAGPIVLRFFQGLVIGALRLTLAIVRVRNWFRRTFGASDMLADLDAQRIALYAGIAVMGLFAATAITVALALGAVAAVAGLVALSLAVFAAPILAIPAAFTAAGVALWTFWGDLQAIDWAGAGRSLIDGFVAGIRSRIDLVARTVGGVARTATDALRNALGIRSPSRVFARLGLEVSRGLALGVDRGAPVAERAVGRVVSVPAEAPAAAGGAATGRAAGATTSVSFGDVHIHAQTDDARGLAQSFRDQVAELFEGLAIQAGAT